MSIKQKAKQLALTLVGSDQNPQPLIDLLVEMAQWQEQKKIMEVWHDGKEEPKDKSKVILSQVGDKSQTVMTMEYHKEDKKFHIISPLGYGYVVGLDWPNIRWAYPEDILPNK